MTSIIIGYFLLAIGTGLTLWTLYECKNLTDIDMATKLAVAFLIFYEAWKI